MRLKLLAAASILGLCATPALAEEGMWTYDNFPIQRANTALGTDIDQAWLDHARLSSVRLTTGCSAGIVSGEGLVMTNNHCVASCVQNISTPEVQYAETGFTPASREEERRCPGMQAEVLIDISDVTERMQAAGQGLDGSAFTRARDAESGAIESEACEGRDDLRCQVVSLYRGGQGEDGGGSGQEQAHVGSPGITLLPIDTMGRWRGANTRRDGGGGASRQ